MSKKSTGRKKARTPAQQAATQRMLAARAAKQAQQGSQPAKKRKTTSAYSATAKSVKPAKKNGGPVAAIAKRVKKLEATVKEHGQAINAHAEALDQHSADISLLRSIGGAYGGSTTKRQTARDTIQMPAFPAN